MASTQLLQEAHDLYIRAGGGTSTAERPAIYKTIGIVLAVASGLFIGVSFIFSKMGLLKANEKYDEIPGEGYGYLKNAWWWGGMSLMIVGEICNFVAYAFTDAILVASLGALSVVISTILSAIFLKERLSAVGVVGCFLCILGSIVISLNIPSSSSVTNIQQMQSFVVQPGILVYGGLVIVGCIFTALWVGPRYGNKTVLVYLSICSLIGGLSVVATQGLGAAILAQIGGQNQFNQWFLYVLFVFVAITLVTEIIYLNKALNIFNAALVTPTYYVYFTSATIVTSAILFKGFGGTASQIITVIMGFLTICSGVVLLQLSKSAKDVPDAAVFAGDLDQLRTIAEQEQPESEPKADAIRGTAAIIRRLSSARQKMELAEARRLHDEMHMDLEPLGENEQIEWDGLRRRRTTLGSARRPYTSYMSPRPPATPVAHPPLGMSHFPTEDEQHETQGLRPEAAGLGSSLLGSLRTRARSMVPGAIRHDPLQSPMHPVPLTEVAIPGYKEERGYDMPLHEQKTAYDPHASFGSGGLAPPPHQTARRQFSFHNVFRKSAVPSVEDERDGGSHKARMGLGSRGTGHSAVGTGATEEERLGLVKGDSRSDVTRRFPDYETDEEHEGFVSGGEKEEEEAPPPPVPKHGVGFGKDEGEEEEEEGRGKRGYRRYTLKGSSRHGSESRGPPTPPHGGSGRGGGAFV